MKKRTATSEWKAQRKSLLNFLLALSIIQLSAQTRLKFRHQTGKKTLKKRMSSFNILQPSQLTSIKSFSL